MAYWYNIENGQVQTDEDHGKGENLMGPYGTEEEARSALASAKERTDAWDEQDKRDDDWGSAPA